MTSSRYCFEEILNHDFDRYDHNTGLILVDRPNFLSFYRRWHMKNSVLLAQGIHLVRLTSLMKKHLKWVAGVILVLLIAGFTGFASAPLALAEAPSLKGTGEIIFPTLGGSWEAALKKAYFEPFTKETGIKVVIVPEDHAKLMASADAGKPYADLTSLSGGMLTSWVKKGLLEDIDYKYFAKETIEGIPSVWRHKQGVGRVVYSMVMAWNNQVFPKGKEPQTWQDFFAPKKFLGPRGFGSCDKIVDGADLEIALMSDGVPFNKIYPIDMDLAFKKLEAFKPNIVKWWSSGSQQPQGLIAGEFDITTAYNGRMYRAIKDGAPIDFTWNQSVLMYDYYVVMKGTPNRDNVMKFLAFSTRADRQAAYAEIQFGGPTNKYAFKHISKDLARWLPGNPEYADKVLTQDYSWWSAMNPNGKTTNWEEAVERCTKMLSR